MILIHASEVAACVGMNPYKSIADMMPIIMRRCDAAAYTRSGIVSQDEADAALVREARVSIPSIDAALCAAEDIGKNASTAEQVCTTVDALMILAEHESCDSKTRAAVVEHGRREAFCGFGTVQEGTSMRGLEELVGVLTKDDKYVKRRVDGTLPVFVGGRIDGFATPHPPSEGGPVLVEIKNRMKRLMRHVVDYERIQVLTYMYIHDQDAAKLIERKGDDVLIHDIVFAPIEWSLIMDALQDFAAKVVRMCECNKASPVITSSLSSPS